MREVLRTELQKVAGNVLGIENKISPLISIKNRSNRTSSKTHVKNK